MVKAIRVHEYGGPEVLKWEDMELGEPKTGEIKIKSKAIGVNYLDIYIRNGLINKNLYKDVPPLPFTPGMEAAGIVMAAGSEVTTCKVGDMVDYVGWPMCAYAEEIILPADRVVLVPRSLDPIIVVAAMFKGLTAQVLIRRCFKVEAGHTILYHAAGGGVGSLVCQWANAVGAVVIGTVSTKEKVLLAKEDGCHHVIIYKEENFVDRVMEITSGKGVDVAYDSIGKDTFEERGYMVLFGIASGEPEPLKIHEVAAKGIYYTVPGMMLYLKERSELLAASEELLSNIEKGILRVRVNHKYSLSQAIQAHLDMESRKTTGSIVLIP